MVKILELEIPFRGLRATVSLMDVLVPSENEIQFSYRIFVVDPEDELEFELSQITPDEHEQIYQAILADLEELCS